MPERTETGSGARSATSAENAAPGQIHVADYGLRGEALSPMETLAQSVSTIAPTSTPAATIPLVAALAGNGTWLAYVLATLAILLVAWCISRFARHSASPGSLYVYAAMILPPWLGAVAAWSLLLAYVATASSVIGGFYHFSNLLLTGFLGRGFSGAALAIIVTGISMWIAWRDIKISARLMLWIEAASLSVILIVVVLLLVQRGFRPDFGQLHLTKMTGGGLRLGLVLALFSFVGFESATTLGAEARNPLRTIPRVVIESAVIAGAFFVMSAYAEVLGFHVAGQDLGTSEAPMQVLAGVARVPALGVLINIGTAVSLFAGTLGCITAAARVLLLMAHNGLAHNTFRNTHEQNETPTAAIIATGLAAVLPVAVLAYRGSSGLDVYGWMGSLATYGFIVTYALVCIALPQYLRHRGVFRQGAQIVPWLAFVAMLLALVGNLYPVPEGPYGKLPYIFIGYLSAGLILFFWQRQRENAQ